MSWTGSGRKLSAGGVAVAVVALSMLGAGVADERTGIAKAIAHAAGTLVGLGDDSGAESAEAHTQSRKAREVADTAGDFDHASGLKTGEGQSAPMAYALAQRGGRRASSLPPPTLAAELSALHSRRDPAATLDDMEPQLDPTLIALASDYSNPLSPDQDIYPRPSRQLEKAASVDGAPGAEGAAAAGEEEACDPTQFASLSGGELVARIKATTIKCLGRLQQLSDSNISATFPESKMMAVANAMAGEAVGYDGTNSSGILNLMTFLHTGYYLKHYNRPVGVYGPELKTAFRSALDRFSGNANFTLVNDAHGEILTEYMVLIDNAHEVTYKLAVYKDLYSRYTGIWGSQSNASAWANYAWMQRAVDVTFGALSRVHLFEASEMASLAQTDASIVNSLYDFVHRNFAALYSDKYYVVENAALEMVRFLKYGGAARTESSARIKQLIGRSSPAFGSATAKLWLVSARSVEESDRANCSAYGVCNFRESVIAQVFQPVHTCSPTLKIRAQSMLPSELAETCAQLAGIESYFHDRLRTGKVPVTDDNNAVLELVVYDSRRMYTTYAGVLYSAPTNNGGIYLEGDPARPGNQARFHAYENVRPEERPKFDIWNLYHEYVHYLDGRFDMYGNYALGTTAKTVWWTEGLAEYMYHDYTKVGSSLAVAEAKLATYPISTIYQNVYGVGDARVYGWGYLAARYMFERQRPSVDSILSYLRPGKYAGYTNFMTSIGTSNDADFRSWLTCVGTVDAEGCAGNQLPSVAFRKVSSGLTVQFMDYSTDADGHIASRTWFFSDGTTAKGPRPVKRFAVAGTYEVSLTVEDDNGGKRSTTGTVTVSALPSCPDADVRRFSQDCERSFVTNPGGAYFYVKVPAGVKQVRLTVSGEAGNADLYVMPPNNGPWASQYRFMHKSVMDGSGEAILIDRPAVGDHTVMIHNNSVTPSTPVAGVITAQFLMN